LRLAEKWNRSAELAILQDIEIEILWTLGRYDEARRALEAHLAAARKRVTEERQVRWEHVRLGVEHRRVAALSNADPLTGLHNRRHLERVLPTLLQGDDRLVVGVIDLDGFKQVNDQLGYAMGDQVIREVAGLLEGVCRRSDTVVRLGGDEFVMVLKGATVEAAERVFGRVRELVEQHEFSGMPDSIRLTASIGVLALDGGNQRDLREVLAEASTAMQTAKRSGKNRITLL
jgi:diguanylate cyclase (GGDEF)-like protein